MDKRLKLLICFVTGLTFLGCSADTMQNTLEVNDKVVDKSKLDYQVGYDTAGMEVSAVASKMADSIFSTMIRSLIRNHKSTTSVDKWQNTSTTYINLPPVAIASFVDTDTLEDSGYLGRYLAEVFVHELSSRDIDVIEYKLTGSIAVTKDGDYLFSRDWSKISNKARVSHVLTGTITRNKDGVVLVARIINMRDFSVIASATGFIPYDYLPYCYRTASKDCKLQGQISYKTQSEKDNEKKVEQLIKELNVYKEQLKKDSGGISGGILYTGNKAINSTISTDVIVPANYVSAANTYPNGAIVPATLNGNYGEYLNDVSDPSYVDKMFGRCGLWFNCDSPVVYPANSYRHNNLIIRDINTQSQYDRVSNK